MLEPATLVSVGFRQHDVYGEGKLKYKPPYFAVNTDKAGGAEGESFE